MVVRRINHTGRKKIRQEDARISLHRASEKAAEFEASLKLSSYGFPPDAAVVIEAYRQTSLMRFDWGTVGFLRLPAERALIDFIPPDGVHFRLKVVDVSNGAGKLLGLAEGISPQAADLPDTPVESLLAVVPADLGQEIWRLDLGNDDNRPKLCINMNIPNWRTQLQDFHFSAYVLPDVLRQILTRVVTEGRPDDDEAEWMRAWCEYAESLPGVGPVPDDKEQVPSWVENAVDGFCRRHEFLSRYTRTMETD